MQDKRFLESKVAEMSSTLELVQNQRNELKQSYKVSTGPPCMAQSVQLTCQESSSFMSMVILHMGHTPVFLHPATPGGEDGEGSCGGEDPAAGGRGGRGQGRCAVTGEGHHRTSKSASPSGVG